MASKTREIIVRELAIILGISFIGVLLINAHFLYHLIDGALIKIGISEKEYHQYKEAESLMVSLKYFGFFVLIIEYPALLLIRFFRK